MKVLLVLGFFLCFTFTLHGQQMPDTIGIVKKQVARFYFEGKKLKPKQMLVMTKPNKEAYKEMLIAQRKYGTAGFFGFVGGFILGWQLGSVFSKMSWGVTR